MKNCCGGTDTFVQEDQVKEKSTGCCADGQAKEQSADCSLESKPADSAASCCSTSSCC